MKPGDKIRFKNCVYNEIGCQCCSKNACKALGNYDLDGWRYDIIAKIDTISMIIRTINNIDIFIMDCDFYTYRSDDINIVSII